MREKLKQISDKVVPILKGFWLKLTQTKFYQNKKIFLPVTIAVGLIVLTILIGVVFGGKKNVQQTIKTTPFPTPNFSENTNTPTPGTDTLSQIEQKLGDLKNQINALDVKQSRLQPPVLDFKIKF